MSFTGTVKNGVVALPPGILLPDGTEVELTPLVSAPAYKATPALEKKLREAAKSPELDCPPEFFTEPLDD